MKKKENKKPYTLTLSPSTMKEVVRLQEKIGVENKSQMVENLIEIGLDNAKVLEGVGLLDLVLAGRDIVKKFVPRIFR